MQRLRIGRAAEIDTDGPFSAARLNLFGPGGEHLHRQVVGAEDAEILQCVQRRGFAGAGKAGDDQQHSDAIAATLENPLLQRLHECLVTVDTALAQQLVTGGDLNQDSQ